MPTVALQVVAVSAATAELPERCPHCGADLTQPVSLRECGWLSEERPCQLVASELGVHPENYEMPTTFNECVLVTGFRCAGCNTMLVGEEG